MRRIALCLLLALLAFGAPVLAGEVSGSNDEIGMLSIIERWTIGTITGNYGGRLIVRVQSHRYMGGANEFSVIFEIPPTERYGRTVAAEIPADSLGPMIDGLTSIISQRAAILQEPHEYIVIGYQASRDVHISFTRDGRDQYGAVVVETEAVLLAPDPGLSRLLDVLKAAQAKLEELRAGS